MIHKNFYAGLVLGLIGLLLIVPGCNTFEALTPKEPVTITFLYWGDQTYYQNMVTKFNETSPHITVELTSWRSMGRGEDMPDFDAWMDSQYRMGFGIETAAPLSLEGLLEPSARDDFYPVALEAFTEEGKLRALPIGCDMTVMYYNKQLFNAMNVPYPPTGWTWADFVEIGEQLTHPDANRFGFAAQALGAETTEVMTFLFQHGGQLFDDPTHPTRMVFNTPANVEALKWYASLFNENQIAPRPGQMSPFPYPDEGIRQGLYAMWHGMLSEYSEYADAIGVENLGVIALPRDVNGASFGGVVGLYLSSESLNPEAGWEWIAFLSQQTLPGLFPARRSIAESAPYAATMSSDVLAAAKNAIGELTVIRFDMSGDFGKTLGASMQAWQAALTEIRSGEDVQTALDKAESKAGQ